MRDAVQIYARYRDLANPSTIKALIARVEEAERALAKADHDMLQMHDWIAEETNEVSRIAWASRAIGDLRAALSIKQEGEG